MISQADRKPCQRCKVVPPPDQDDGVVIVMFSHEGGGGEKVEFRFCQPCCRYLGRQLTDAMEPIFAGFMRNIYSGAGVEQMGFLPGTVNDGFMESMMPLPELYLAPRKKGG